eukprot:109355-Rhodomonas_salina.1
MRGLLARFWRELKEECSKMEKEVRKGAKELLPAPLGPGVLPKLTLEAALRAGPRSAFPHNLLLDPISS